MLGLVLTLSAACGRKAEAPPPPPAPPRLTCDRACLEDLASSYLEAVLAHDPQRVHVLPEFRFTENGAQLDAGDGLWRTASGRGSYLFVVPDEEKEHVVLLASLREDGIPVMLSAHLTVRQRKVLAAETIVLRDERATLAFEKLGPPAAPVLAGAERPTRASLLASAGAYFSALQRNDGSAPVGFAADCMRVENGARVTGVAPRRGEPRADPATATRWSTQWSCAEQLGSGLLYYVSRVRDRRVAAVDPARGLAVVNVVLDHSGGETRRFRSATGVAAEAGPRQPESWLTTALIRAGSDGIHEVTTLSQQVPYGMNPGWSSFDEGLSSQLRDAQLR